MSLVNNPSDYIGRFAPSPTGPLHFGSLVSALASYLDAHHNQGKWLVRMEDLDPPREQAGAADAILRCLEDYSLEWDDTALYQSQRWDIYEDYLSRLRQQDLLYPCDCTRQDLQSMGGIYNGRCRSRHVNTGQPHAQRLKLYDLPTDFHQNDELIFTDLIQGEQIQNLRTQTGDQILKRKDGLYAYQLAVVVDDIEQNISHIIRGSDLLEVTARQIFLFQLLNASIPAFGHVTLASQPNGQKLSKQNLAPALELKDAGINLWQALVFLGQNPPQELYGATPKELLDWGKNHWQLHAIHGLSAVYGAILGISNLESRHPTPYYGIYWYYRRLIMAKNTSITLGNHFDEFISSQLESGRYGSASEIVRAGLRLLEDSESKLQVLRNMLIEGEESGIADYNYKDLLSELDK